MHRRLRSGASVVLLAAIVAVLVGASMHGKRLLRLWLQAAAATASVTTAEAKPPGNRRNKPTLSDGCMMPSTAPSGGRWWTPIGRTAWERRPRRRHPRWWKPSGNVSSGRNSSRVLASMIVHARRFRQRRSAGSVPPSPLPDHHGGSSRNESWRGGRLLVVRVIMEVSRGIRDNGAVTARSQRELLRIARCLSPPC